MKTAYTENDYFEKAPVWQAIVHMSVPMILGMCVNLIYNLLDTYFIGQLHQTALISASTLTLPLFALLMAVGSLFGTGGGTYISRLLGQKRGEDAKKAASVTAFYGIAAGVVLAVVLLLCLNPILHLLGATGDVLAPTRAFAQIYLLGSPALIGSFTLEQVVRAEGASKTSMVGMAISVGINVALDPLFIFGFHFGMAGAAGATVLGNLGAVIFYLIWLRTKSTQLDAKISLIRPTKEMNKEIFKVGVTALIQDSFLVVSSLLFNNLLMAYGDPTVAAFGIAQRVTQLPEFLGMGLSFGVIPLIAYSFSAKNRGRMMEVFKKTSLAILVLVLAADVLLFLFRLPICRLFSTDSRVLQVGSLVLTAMLISTLFNAFAGLFTGTFQGIGDGKKAGIMSVLQGILLIPTAIIGDLLFKLNGVIWALTAAEVVAGVIGAILWFTSQKHLAVSEPKEASSVPV